VGVEIVIRITGGRIFNQLIGKKEDTKNGRYRFGVSLQGWGGVKILRGGGRVVAPKKILGDEWKCAIRSPRPGLS